MTVTDAPKIVTRHIGNPESWTLKGLPGVGRLPGTAQGAHHGPAPHSTKRSTRPTSSAAGGAGFEAGRKWGMLRKAEPVYLVINGDESEPATFKDHVLIEQDPHQIIEGTLITAYVVQASLVFIYIRGEFALGLERITAALNEAYDYGAVGRNVFGSGWSIDVIIHPGAGAYICGDETGLLESLEGKRGFPRIKPPFFPAAFGLYQAPTVVNNVETMSNVPWIVTQRRGGLRRPRCGPLQGHPDLRGVGPRQAAGQLRGGDGQDHLPRPPLRPRVRRRHPRRP